MLHVLLKLSLYAKKYMCLCCHQLFPNCNESYIGVKADFQSVEFSERAEILLFAGENVALKLNR